MLRPVFYPRHSPRHKFDTSFSSLFTSHNFEHTLAQLPNKKMTNNNMLITDDACSIVGSQEPEVLGQQSIIFPSDVRLETPPGAMLPGGAVLSKNAPINSESEHEKKMRRVMANRKSAKESRDRRRNLLKKLETQVDVLAAENQSMARANAELRSHMQQLKQQLTQALALTRQLQHPRSPMDENSFSDCQMKYDEEPYQLTSMVKSECLEPFDMQDACSLWKTSDVWEPLLSVQ